MSKIKPIKRVKRRQIKGYRGKIKADLIHEVLENVEDANKWKLDFYCKYYYSCTRSKEPKSNPRNNGTRKRLLVRKLRTKRH